MPALEYALRTRRFVGPMVTAPRAGTAWPVPSSWAGATAGSCAGGSVGSLTSPTRYRRAFKNAYSTTPVRITTRAWCTT
jgi:hypothetical protein